MAGLQPRNFSASDEKKDEKLIYCHSGELSCSRQLEKYELAQDQMFLLVLSMWNLVEVGLLF